MAIGKSVFMSYVTCVVLVAQLQVSWGQNRINIVSPSELAEVEGNNVQDAGHAGRAQFLYPASDFMSVPESHRIITGLAWRPDQSNTFTSPVSGPARILLSTTAVDDLSTTFANNIGDDETLVFEGTLTWQTDASGPGPRAFDYSVQFDKPFRYDPRQGQNLLLEFVPTADWDNVGNWQIDAEINTAGNITLVGTGNPSASTATGASRDSHWPTQFTFVPEPSTTVLSARSCWRPTRRWLCCWSIRKRTCRRARPFGWVSSNKGQMWLCRP